MKVLRLIGLEAIGVNVAAILKGADLGGCTAFYAAGSFHFNISRLRCCFESMSLLLEKENGDFLIRNSIISLRTKIAYKN